MSIYLAIAAGGSLGAMSRYWVSMTTYQWLGQHFPHGTLLVNLLGSLAMGFLSVLLVHRFQVSDEIRFGLLAEPSVARVSSLTSYESTAARLRVTRSLASGESTKKRPATR